MTKRKYAPGARIWRNISNEQLRARITCTGCDHVSYDDVGELLAGGLDYGCANDDCEEGEPLVQIQVSLYHSPKRMAKK